MRNVVNKIVMCLIGAAIGAVLMPRASMAQSASVPKREDTVATGGSDCSDRHSKGHEATMDGAHGSRV
jgi:hypothetical protein